MRHPYPLAAKTIIHQHYRIIRILGSGGFGITYLVEHTLLKKPFVIKEYFPADLAQRTHESNTVQIHHHHHDIFQQGLKYFYREAQLLHSFNHPNIISVSDLFEENQTAYFVMPHIQGITLDKWLNKHPTPPLHQLAKIFTPLLDALKYIHHNKILHRDIKPQNIILSPNAPGPVLIDFGAAGQYLAGKTRSTMMFISEGYSPIEQYSKREKLTPATDLYSLCACLYHAVCGEIPPPATDRIHNPAIILADQPQYTAHYPRHWLAALDKGFSLLAQDRYTDAPTMQAALFPKRPHTTNQSTTPPTTPPNKKNKWLKFKTIFLLLMMIGIINGGIVLFLDQEMSNNHQALPIEQDNTPSNDETTDADQQYALGKMYYDKQDYQQAFDWFSKAAEQGNASAQFSLGAMYYNGEGVQQDYQQAVYWFSKAAEQGNATAQYNLGVMYDNGEGVQQNHQKAVYWYSKAAEQNDNMIAKKFAKEALQRLQSE